MSRRPKTYETGLSPMVKPRMDVICILGGLALLVSSCGTLEQLDYDKPVKPLPKAIDMAMVDRIRHMNKQWYPVDNK